MNSSTDHEFPSAPEVVVKMIRADHESLKGKVRMLSKYVVTGEQSSCFADLRYLVANIAPTIEEAEEIFK